MPHRVLFYFFHKPHVLLDLLLFLDFPHEGGALPPSPHFGLLGFFNKMEDLHSLQQGMQESSVLFGLPADRTDGTNDNSKFSKGRNNQNVCCQCDSAIKTFDCFCCDSSGENYDTDSGGSGSWW